MSWRIQRDLGEHAQACVALARKLPQYFTQTAVARMARDFVTHELYVALAGSDLVGFLTFHRDTPAVAELSWIAVAPDRQRQGVGSALVAATVADLRGRRCRFLKAKTLAPTMQYVPYDGTRAFYQRHGFVHLETVDPYPGWDPGNPCAIYVRSL